MQTLSLIHILSVSCVRIIQSMDRYGHTIGALAVDLSNKRLEGILSDISVFGGNNVVIIDGTGMVISSVVQELVGTCLFDGGKLEELVSSDSGSIQYDDENGRYSVIYRSIKAVSYTHLDVYKRQLLYCGILRCICRFHHHTVCFRCQRIQAPPISRRRTSTCPQALEPRLKSPFPYRQL